MEQRWRGWIQLLLGLALTLLFFYMMAPFLVAILLGAVIAIISYPLYLPLRQRVPRILAGLIVTLGIVIGILAPMFFLLYSGAYRLLALFSKFRLPTQGTLDFVIQHPVISKGLKTLSHITPVDNDWLRSQALTVLETIVERLSKLITAFIAGMPGLLVAFLVVMISVYFFLVDGSRFLKFLSSLSPLKQERSNDLYGAFEKSCRGVVLGLLTSSLAQAVLIGLFFEITGLPTPLFIAAITFFMGMVPVVGSAPLWIGATLYLFLNGHYIMAMVMLMGGVCIIASDNVVRPLIMKGQSELHPLLALVSVFGAVDLFGATGIFLGPVIAAVFVSFLRIISLEIRRENVANLSDQPRPQPLPPSLSP